MEGMPQVQKEEEFHSALAEKLGISRETDKDTWGMPLEEQMLMAHTLMQEAIAECLKEEESGEEQSLPRV